MPLSLSSDSDSDDNVPLSKLRADAAVVKKDEIKAEVKQEVKQEVAHEANGSIKPEIKAQVSDSDDDVPIVGLARRKKLKVETKPVKTEPSTATPRFSAVTPRKTKKRIKIKYKQQECTEELYKTPKGELTQALLCRWWYALEWPPVKANAPVRCWFCFYEEVERFS